MPQNDGLNRRSFLRNAGMTALVGAVGSGSPLAVASAAAAVVAENGKFDFDTPYNRFGTDLTDAKRIGEAVPIRRVSGRYSIDFDEFERHIGPDTNVYILCNPQNPTGNTWSQADLMKIGEICLKRRVVVLADEIHCDFVQKGQKYTPFAT